MKKDARIKKAYSFLQAIRSSPIEFTAEQLANATGYSEGTVKSYALKYWHRFLTPTGNGYYSLNHFEDYTEEAFIRLTSQKTSINQEPFKPKGLTDETEQLLRKSRESALLAVQIFNNPLIAFRTPGFIVQMVIAYTSLFHAIFGHNKQDCFYRDEAGNPVTIKGGIKYWELGQCIEIYWPGETNPIKSNIEFFIEVRNEVEHRFAPAFDSSISGECQALLFNYEGILVEHFGAHYSIGVQVAVPIQLSRLSHQARLEALKELQKTDYLILKELTESYRKSLPDTVASSQDYAFRVFLIPKVGTRSSSDASIEFIKAEDLTEEKEQELQKCITLIKTKNVPVVNPGKLKPKMVVTKLQERGLSKFNMKHHALAWKHYKVRTSEFRADGCDPKYCHFDEPHNDFIYTEEWVDFLFDQLSDPSEYERLLASGRKVTS